MAKADRGIGRQCRPRLSQPGLTPSVNCPTFFSLPLHAGMSDGDGLPQRRHRDSSHISHSKDFWTGWQFGRLLSGLCIGIQKACQRSSRWEIIGNKGGDISCTKDLQTREKGGRALVNLSKGFFESRVSWSCFPHPPYAARVDAAHVWVQSQPMSNAGTRLLKRPTQSYQVFAAVRNLSGTPLDDLFGLEVRPSRWAM